MTNVDSTSGDKKRSKLLSVRAEESRRYRAKYPEKYEAAKKRAVTRRHERGKSLPKTIVICLECGLQFSREDQPFFKFFNASKTRIPTNRGICQNCQ